MVPTASFTLYINHDVTNPESPKPQDDIAAVDLPTAPGVYKDSFQVFALSSSALRANLLHCHSHIAMYYSPEKVLRLVCITVGTIDERSSHGGVEAAERVLRATDKEIFWGEKASWWAHGGVGDHMKGEPERFERFDNEPGMYEDGLRASQVLFRNWESSRKCCES